MIGQTLGHYRVLEQIGAGGMGVVYRAHDERLDRDVALKVLPPGTLTDENARKRFRKEAVTLSKLNHPNIETVFDFDTQDGVDFLVMELIPGVTLDETLAAGALPEREVIRLGMQLAEGLAAAHAEGVIHRDLKPGNLRPTPDGRLKILDFGLAKLLGPVSGVAATESLSKTHGAVGTLPYMAPEQLRGEAADARSDIWAAGAVLYEMVTGRRPFDARVSTALAGDIQYKPPPPPRQLQPELSPRVEDILLKCLEKDPDNRYQSARELAIDLRRLAAPASSAAVTSVVPPAKTRWKFTTGVSLALVLALVAAVAILNPGNLRDRALGRAAAPPITSLAVLPLENLSRDPEQEYFADAMTEELTTNLSKIGALKVISRTSAMRYKGANKPLPQIARELGVDAVIEGSVLRVGGRVRITAQLIQATSDQHLWAESYERDLSDILAVQSEVSRAITNEIKITLTPQEQTRLASTRRVNPEAYQAFLKGKYENDPKKALAYLQQAIALDPTYAPTYVTLGRSYASDAFEGVRPVKEAVPLARAAVEKALELDPTLAEAHAELAFIKDWFDWDWAGAEQEIRRTILLNPNNATAHGTYGSFLVHMARPDEAIREFQKEQELDPLNSFGFGLGFALYYGRRHDESIAQFNKVLKKNPDNAFALGFVGLNYAQKRMYPEAVAACRRAVSIAPEDQLALGTCGWVYGLAGRRQDALAVLDRVKKLSPRLHLDPYLVATLYDGLGDNDRAMEWLERAYRERSPQMAFLRVEFWSDSLRAEPRFQDLLRRMNFPP